MDTGSKHPGEIMGMSSAASAMSQDAVAGKVASESVNLTNQLEEALCKLIDLQRRIAGVNNRIGGNMLEEPLPQERPSGFVHCMRSQLDDVERQINLIYAYVNELEDFA